MINLNLYYSGNNTFKREIQYLSVTAAFADAVINTNLFVLSTNAGENYCVYCVFYTSGA